jgi:hypothetical protein
MHGRVWGGRHERTTEAGLASRVKDPISLVTSPSAEVFPIRGFAWLEPHRRNEDLCEWARAIRNHGSVHGRPILTKGALGGWAPRRRAGENADDHEATAVLA